MKNRFEPYFEAFDLQAHRSIYLIGGGGKTSLMYSLARELQARGQKVLTTTTTKILEPEKAQAEQVLLVSDYRDFSSFLKVLSPTLAQQGHVTVAAERIQGVKNKLKGLTVEQVDGLVAAGMSDTVLVEADGSAGRSLKAHQDREPVVSAKADLVIVGMGVDCSGMPIEEQSVHRMEIFCERTGVQPGTLVSPKEVVSILFHPEGYLKNVTPTSKVSIFISKANTKDRKENAEKLAAAIKNRDSGNRISAVMWGDLKV